MNLHFVAPNHIFYNDEGDLCMKYYAVRAKHIDYSKVFRFGVETYWDYGIIRIKKIMCVYCNRRLPIENFPMLRSPSRYSYNNHKPLECRLCWQQIDKFAQAYKTGKESIRDYILNDEFTRKNYIELIKTQEVLNDKK